MRTAPKAWIGIAVWAAYVVVVFVLGKVSGVPYTDMGDSTQTLVRGPLMFLAGGAVFAILATTVLGWWGPALREERRSRRTWPVVPPALMALSILLTLSIGTDWGELDAAYIAGVVALGVLVGFNEEIVTRGLLLTGLRARVREPLAWFLSSALFGLMHAVNAANGQPLSSTLSQIAFAFLGGTTFYIVRRVTGSLVWAMVLHGAWDAAAFTSGQAPGPVGVGSSVGLLAQVLALVFVFWTFADRETTAAPATPARVDQPLK